MMTRTQIQNEQDYRVSIINSLLTVPHRDLKQVVSIHTDIAQNDPLFYLHLAAWYFDNGSVRDHKEAFVIGLSTHNNALFRDVGAALLSTLPPYQVARVVNYMAENKITVPRTLKTEIKRYLKEREENAEWFDSAVLQARKYLKRLYTYLHIKPGDRAQAILFDEKPPSDSRLDVLKKLVNTNDPGEQARLIVDNKVPYRVASTVIKNMTPSVLYALIDVMSSQELINNMNSIRKRGALNHKEIKKLVDEKLELAKKDKRVTAMKTIEAVRAGDFDEETQEKLLDVGTAKIQSGVRIKRPTALFVDKSFSMHEGIQVGKKMATVVATAMDAPFYCYAFDYTAFELVPYGGGLKGWDQTFSLLKANGSTFCGAPFEQMAKKKQVVEQIVLVTDEGENGHPRFVDAIETYSRALGIEKPSVLIVRCGQKSHRHTIIHDALVNRGCDVTAYEFDGDYNSLENLVTFLTKKSKSELVTDIMSYKLPERKKNESVGQTN